MSTVIFDFDGTIADSFAYVYEFLAAEAGKPQHIAKEDERLYRNLSMKDMALRLGIPVWRLPFLYFKGRKTMRGHLLTVKPFPGINAVIKQLHEEGHALAIVSSNSARNVRKFLKSNDLNLYFKIVRGGAGFLGKVTPIKQIRRRLKNDDCWYVGDEVTDIASAKAAGVKTLAVAWGFGGADKLRHYDPTALALQATDIPKIVATQ